MRKCGSLRHRTWGWHIPVLVSLVAAVSGCGQVQYSAPVLQPPSSSIMQAVAEQLVQKFVADLNAKRYADAGNLVAPALRNDWSPKNVQKHLTRDGYWMLVGSKNWKYNEVQTLKHGNELVVHAQFTNDPQNMLYHTNFSFAKTGAGWKIDYVMNPVQKTRPVAVHLNGPVQTH